MRALSPAPNVPLAPTRARKRNTTSQNNKVWTPEDDNLIASFADGKEHINWAEVATHFPGKSSQQIADRWMKVLDPRLLKGSWTKEEDEQICEYVAQNGTKSWTKLAALLPGRIGKQCRERWVNHLDPEVNRAPWTPEEDRLITDLHTRYGNKWTLIGKQLKNRPENAIKNRWNSTLAKRQEIPKPSVVDESHFGVITQFSPDSSIVSPPLTPLFSSPTSSSLSQNRAELMTLLFSV